MTLHAHLDPADASTGLCIVREIITVPDGCTLGEDFGSAELAAACRPCDAAVAAGMVYDPVATTFGPAPVSAADLAAARAGAKAQIDAVAETLRLMLITPGSGQAMEYQEAYAEAVQVDQAARTGQAVDAAAFPMLSASIGYDRDPATGKASIDIAGEARAVLAAYDAYQRVGAAIRAARLKGKAALDAAPDPAAVRAAVAAIVWPALA